jgi:ribosomal protein L29
MNKKKINYGEKVLKMDQFLNYYFNSSYGKDGILADELSRFYSALHLSHREMDQYLQDLKLELMVLSRQKTIEKLKQEIETCNTEYFNMMEQAKNSKEKKAINDYFAQKTRSLHDEAFKLTHIDDLLSVCDNFTRLSNDDVKEFEVLTGNAILVADAENHKAYYANPERDYFVDHERTMYDAEHATTVEKDTYNLRNVNKVLRRSKHNDKH